MNGCTGLTGAVEPKPGDLSICIRCAAPLKFGPELELERLTLEDLEQLPQDVVGVIVRARSAVIRANNSRGLH